MVKAVSELVPTRSSDWPSEMTQWAQTLQPNWETYEELVQHAALFIFIKTKQKPVFVLPALLKPSLIYFRWTFQKYLLFVYSFLQQIFIPWMHLCQAPSWALDRDRYWNNSTFTRFSPVCPVLALQSMECLCHTCSLNKAGQMKSLLHREENRLSVMVIRTIKGSGESETRKSMLVPHPLLSTQLSFWSFFLLCLLISSSLSLPSHLQGWAIGFSGWQVERIDSSVWLRRKLIIAQCHPSVHILVPWHKVIRLSIKSLICASNRLC